MYQAQRYFHTLELDKVLAKLADQANCDDSKRMALSLTPSDDFSTVQLLMKKTSDAYMLSARYTSPSLHKLKNCEMALRKAEKRLQPFAAGTDGRFIGAAQHPLGQGLEKTLRGRKYLAGPSV